MSAQAGKGALDPDDLAQRYRDKALDLPSRKLLITNFKGSLQESDLSTPSNCGGLGRVRHFRRKGAEGWPSNPLPIDPACKALGLAATEVMEAQAFQNAVCNWRCWYCYVDFQLLSGSTKHSEWASASELVRRYSEEPMRPRVIDLTGGQPDITPEWIPWTITALREHGLANETYVWSDDNLSNDFYWRFLGEGDRRLVAGSRNYGRVGCFKGFDAQSFAFNTGAPSSHYDRQFSLMARLIEEGLDVYAYVTLTAPTSINLEAKIAQFMDRLQEVGEVLPLRTVPLRVEEFSPVSGRLDDDRRQALVVQDDAVHVWQSLLEERFSPSQRQTPICDVRL